jgi:exodeoxyribonuclease-3
VKIATFNVNGINGRLPVLLRWLEEAQPGIACLQELKAPQDKFPAKALTDAGYQALWHGRPRRNGVAILARIGTIQPTRRGLPDDPDPAQSRCLEAAVNGVLVACLYLPNGNPRPGPKYDYKLTWFDALTGHATFLLDSGLPVVLAGDFNVIPTPTDVYKPERWQDDALRTLHPDAELYTFWDYLRHAWSRNAGLRLDHLLLSPTLAPRLRTAAVDSHVRGWDRASDHAPVWIKLAEG